nr:hypothetical protein [Paenibacillus sp. UNC496MF]
MSVPELRFTMDELEAYGAGMTDVPLSGRQLDRLLDRTEGWIAGLQLAFISLRTREKFIADFQGRNRNVAEFLFEEAFGHLPADIRAFLLATSVLDRMNAEAANAVTGRPDGREMLARLNALQLFLIPLGERGEWFRYHQLFATFLRGLLKRDDPAGWLLANRKASGSCAGLGLLGEAIDHAIAAGDFALTRALLERHVAPVFRQGELAALLRWFGSLPADAPWPADMRLLYALILAITGQADLAEGQLAGIGDETERRAVRSGMLFVESNVIFFGGRFERWQTFAEGASADMLPDSRIFYDVNYNLTEPLVRRTTLGLKGLLNPHTEAVGLGFLRVLETHGWQETFIGLYVRQSLAEGYYEWNRLEDSRAYARGLEAAARRTGLPGLYVPLAITRARLLLADRQPQLAHEAIDLAMEAAETHEEPQWLSGLRGQGAGLSGGGPAGGRQEGDCAARLVGEGQAGLQPRVRIRDAGAAAAAAAEILGRDPAAGVAEAAGRARGAALEPRGARAAAGAGRARAGPAGGRVRRPAGGAGGRRSERLRPELRGRGLGRGGAAGGVPGGGSRGGEAGRAGRAAARERARAHGPGSPRGVEPGDRRRAGAVPRDGEGVPVPRVRQARRLLADAGAEPGGAVGTAGAPRVASAAAIRP